MTWKTRPSTLKPDPYAWQRWWAWYPVDIDGTTYWLCYISRRLHNSLSGVGYYTYRLPDQPNT